MEKKIKTIKIDWNNLKSIQNAEKLQMRLMNRGYNLIEQTVGVNSSSLTYTREK